MFGRRKLEAVVLNTVWTFESRGIQGVTVHQVLGAACKAENHQWAYTTIKTILDRLVGKAYLERSDISGHRFLYKSTAGRETLRQRAMKELLDAFFDGDIQQMESTVAALKETGHANPF